MGKNNQARRAAKAKSRARQRSRDAHQDRAQGQRRSGDDFWFSAPGPQTTPPAPGPDARMLAEQLWAEVLARDVSDGGDPAEQRELLELLGRLDRAVVLEVAETQLLRQVTVLYAHGWQPSELLRQVRLCAGSPAARLTCFVMAADHARRSTERIDERWLRQLREADLPASAHSRRWLAEWANAAGASHPDTIQTVRVVLAALATAPPLEVLIPPPSGINPATPVRQSAAAVQADPVLQKVRALLAKAESTEYEAEASALTAKAQDLMTRHAIDLATVEAIGAARGEPSIIRVAVDPPYADAKALLLQTVAAASRCRAISMPTLSMSSVVGYPVDLEAVQLLFTSLLVQAQHALRLAASRSGPGDRPRSQRFRSAFLLGFADRISGRLEQANRTAYADAAGSSTAFLPVLRSREERIDEFIDERWGELTSGRVRGGYDGAGWVSGSIAGDAAELTSGKLTSR